MKQRIRNKIAKKWHFNGVRYTIRQVLTATKGRVIWTRWRNGYDYHIGYDGRIYKREREENCPSCVHYNECMRKYSKSYPIGDKYICVSYKHSLIK